MHIATMLRQPLNRLLVNIVTRISALAATEKYSGTVGEQSKSNRAALSGFFIPIAKPIYELVQQ
jgi:hypothetical protein